MATSEVAMSADVFLLRLCNNYSLQTTDARLPKIPHSKRRILQTRTKFRALRPVVAGSNFPALRTCKIRARVCGSTAMRAHSKGRNCYVI